MRAYHDQALIDEFLRRGIDVSAIYEGLRIGDETSGIGKVISFAHPVRYDIADNRRPPSAEIPLISKIPPLPSALGNGRVYTS
jgi:hypothetical protein